MAARVIEFIKSWKTFNSLHTGTGRAAEAYKTGKKTTDVTLEILNLNKTEVITIDIISNQEFSEVIKC